ncbi:MAG: hypothetical protein AMJ54_06685 [Deltaproteobacteria bacterium SG8_13]|nr:MAG: hypothetical protein AMJ54_06685 [Deltaproteobacteria bacterium SG8_13]
MKTFAQPRRFVDHPHFEADRKRALRKLVLDEIDAPIRDIVDGLSKLAYCFTLQSCFGHFIHSKAPAADNLAPLPSKDVGAVTYRIAYVALCLQDTTSGNRLLCSLAEVPSIAPEFVQFGSPGWFWERQVNSFALQVEPSRFADQDQATIDHAEALQVEKVRDQFFTRLGDLVASLYNGRVPA